MLQEIILAGFGGQGVMSMGQLLAYAGMFEGEHVSWIPSYGPEMRGGTANCSVTLSDLPISSPVISEPNTLIVLNRPSLEKFEKGLKTGGLLLMNSSLIDISPQRDDIQVVKIPSDDLANNKFGNSRVANMILLGAFLELTHAVSLESVEKALKKVLPEYRYNLISMNRDALELGVSIVK
ncbi:2-oxoacid:acceptor oxidoreductase family protein [Desulfitobacterium metallireducens]|uniref:2-oxoglutarate ferredoxin oxidoreductase subunit gamma n=1 Tax=Desulfitobacterium metallireducens DSM 15288 TaxID=871968 RepID=W0EDT2_9FIRM|nr:2-oxoacid:acceptor oxidoreductase family protein [Desulfitobacterium metallireducens]AHF07359.1 2-oxoglutarate ferredoxin oxidoreductase subunit gamma [Desulfitobacterium metallireducens DSM 15288]